MSTRPEPGSDRRLVLVVGIGRSGTSLFTGILGQLGFHVPQPEVQADETNPRGFSEPRWVVDFHTRLMRARHVSRFDARPAAWESTAEAAGDEDVVEELKSWLTVQFVGANSIVVKDPRLDWFLPLWLRCSNDLDIEVSFATMLRYPAEMVKSARQSYGTWQSDASRAASWLNVTLQSEYATRGARRAFLRYDALLEDWAREISRAGALLDIPWLRGIEASDFPRIDDFVDPALRRATVGWDEVLVPSMLQEMLEEVWGHVSRLAEPGGDTEEAHAALDAARAAYARLYADAEAIAQSSVIALKPRRGRVAGSAERTGGNAGGRAGSLRSQVTRIVPGRPLGDRGLATLPIRMALRVPVRYRERVPVPVVRAVVRVARALHR